MFHFSSRLYRTSNLYIFNSLCTTSLAVSRFHMLHFSVFSRYMSYAVTRAGDGGATNRREDRGKRAKLQKDDSVAAQSVTGKKECNGSTRVGWQHKGWKAGRQ